MCGMVVVDDVKRTLKVQTMSGENPRARYLISEFEMQFSLEYGAIAEMEIEFWKFALGCLSFSILVCSVSYGF